MSLDGIVACVPNSSETHGLCSVIEVQTLDQRGKLSVQAGDINRTMSLSGIVA